MIAQAGTGQQSMNAGEFSPDLAGRVDIKQYYSAGLRYRNVEPVAQAGFRNLPGTVRLGPVGSAIPPRFWRLKNSRDVSFLVALLPRRLDIFSGFNLIAQPAIPELTPAMQAEASLYLEGDTIGVFHRDLQPKRVLRQPNGHWTVDNWPFGRIPRQDYGGAYPKTADVWTLFFRWSEEPPTEIAVSITVNGETIESEQMAGAVQVAGDVEWSAFADLLQAGLRELPSLGPGVTVVPGRTYPLSRELVVTFGGDLSGSEYDLTAQVVNTSEVSLLPSHSSIGRTTAEALISAVRGWPGFVTITQDRLLYAALKSRSSALLFSQTAEYFNINTEAQREDGAKLEALRTQSAEEILHVKALQYILVFTDEAEYFATNRVISRNDPLNFVETSRNGMARGTWPVEIENRIYYVGQRGAVLFSTAYDDISSAFTSRQESLLASHLVDDIVMSDIQRGTDDTDAPRLWLLRRDGRLVGASIIRDQEITAFFEYDVGGPVRSIGVDSNNRLRLVVEREGGLQYEAMDPATHLAGSVFRVSDQSGNVGVLPFPEGTEVWAELANGFIGGPYLVQGGGISTEWRGEAMRVAPWVPPLWESMPRILVTAGDKIIRRPGRIHTVRANVIGTTSIAIGANGIDPRNKSLLRTCDPTDVPMAAKTGLVTMAGIPGKKRDTTAVITQTRPGALRVRDVVLEERL